MMAAAGDLAATPLWRLEVTVPFEQVGVAELIFEGVSVAVSSFGDDDIPWRVEGYTDAAPDLAAIQNGLALALGLDATSAPKVSVEFLTPRDWLAENMASFQPIRVDRFFIHPSHYDGPVPVASIPFRIDAGTAFGSGTHPTTATCLRALTRIARKRKVRSALDLGCGSGLLAFAIAKLWPAMVLAVDIDPEAVRVTRANAQGNGLRNRVHAVVGDGLRNPELRAARPFDLIVANVLARPLISMAGDVAGALAPGGALVLSGLLERDAAWVAGRYRARGFVYEGRIVHEDWATLMLRKSG